MRFPRILALSPALIIFMPGNAFAAAQGLLLIGGIDQSLQIDYSFAKRESSTSDSSTSSTSQFIKEKYNVRTYYSIYNEHLLNGRAEVSFGLNQNFLNRDGGRSDKSNSSILNYRIDGNVLDRKNFPITFFSSSATTTVQTQFAGSYDTKVDTFGFGFRIHSKYLPVRFNYTMLNNETSGRSIDTTFKNKNLSFEVTHAAGHLSRTDLMVNHSSSNSRSSDGVFASNYSLTNFALTNLLSWNSKGRAREILSRVDYQFETREDTERTWSIAEGVHWDLGKALTAYLDLKNLSSTYRDKEESTGKARLRHRLYRNLFTDIEAAHRSTSFSFGKETESSARVAINYQKDLPAQAGSLQLAFTKGYAHLDRNFDSTTTEITDNPFRASPFSPITLQVPGIIPESIVVTNADHTIRFLSDKESANPDFGLNIDPQEAMIFVIPDGRIVEGETILVSFVSVIDPSINYVTSTRSMSGSLSLYNNMIRLYAANDVADQDVKSGTVDPSFLNGYRSTRAGTELNIKDYAFKGELLEYNDGRRKTRSVEASISRTIFWNRSSLRLLLRDRYSRGNKIPGPDDFFPEDTEVDNTFLAGAVYNRNLGSLGQARISLDYLNTRGKIDRDDLSLLGSLRMQFGKMFLDIMPEFRWKKTGESTKLEERLRVQLIRYF